MQFTGETEIDAPLKLCLDLARNVDVHLTIPGARERVIDGVSSGVMELGDHVTWETRRFGLRIRMTSVITELSGDGFTDEMRKGPFKSWHHRHRFEPVKARIVMTDEIEYDMPFGFLGRIADVLFVRRYMSRLLAAQNAHIKKLAETRAMKGEGDGR